jgi:hypothetical protein
MGHGQRVSALSVLALTVIGVPAFAQRPGTPADPMPLSGQSQQPVSKSDEHRIVGKVLHIDQREGLVKLATEEGVLVVGVASPTLQTFRVGDVVSVPRAAAESPSASPRNK